MQYLTTHDFVWINTTIKGSVQSFDYLILEAAMAAQYQYGDSRDVPIQAANLLQKLLIEKPFAAGNRRTALIGALTFLNVNHYATIATDEDIVKSIVAIESGVKSVGEVIAAIAAPAKLPLPAMTLRQLITHECNHHLVALASLGAND